MLAPSWEKLFKVGMHVVKINIKMHSEWINGQWLKCYKWIMHFIEILYNIFGKLVLRLSVYIF